MINFKQFMKQNKFFAYGLPFVVCCLTLNSLNLDLTVRVMTANTPEGMCVLSPKSPFNSSLLWSVRPAESKEPEIIKSSSAI